MRTFLAEPEHSMRVSTRSALKRSRCACTNAPWCSHTAASTLKLFFCSVALSSCCSERQIRHTVEPRLRDRKKGEETRGNKETSARTDLEVRLDGGNEHPYALGVQLSHECATQLGQHLRGLLRFRGCVIHFHARARVALCGGNEARHHVLEEVVQELRVKV